MVLGTNPDSYPGLTANPSAPISLFTVSARSPEAGVNSPVDSIRVKQVYGDVLLPIGQSFVLVGCPVTLVWVFFRTMAREDPAGRHHSRGEQADGGDSADRIMFLTKLRGIILGAGWDLRQRTVWWWSCDRSESQHNTLRGVNFKDPSEAQMMGLLPSLLSPKPTVESASDKLLASGKSSTNYGAILVYREQRQDFLVRPQHW